MDKYHWNKMKLNIPTIQVLENEMKIHNIDGKRAKYL